MDQWPDNLPSFLQEVAPPVFVNDLAGFVVAQRSRSKPSEDTTQTNERELDSHQLPRQGKQSTVSVPAMSSNRQGPTVTNSQAQSTVTSSNLLDESDGLEMPGKSFSRDFRIVCTDACAATEDLHHTSTSQMLNADGTPKRPMNAFMLFARKRRPQISAANQMMRTDDISKMLGKEWNAMKMVSAFHSLRRSRFFKYFIFS